MSELTALAASQVGGMTGATCLANYEQAQRHESLARTPHGMVSTLGEFPLNEAQVDLARKMWTLTLAQKAADVPKPPVLVCDDINEMPNMKDVP